MGYNTVVLILNDHAHELEKSPHALTFAVTHPPNYNYSDDQHMEMWWKQVESVAKDHNEEFGWFRNGLRVLPTFHADDKHVLIAGWNSLIRPKYEDYKYNKKKNELTIKMPEYWLR
jgi:hypothetical protein